MYVTSSQINESPHAHGRTTQHTHNNLAACLTPIAAGPTTATFESATDTPTATRADPVRGASGPRCDFDLAWLRRGATAGTVALVVAVLVVAVARIVGGAATGTAGCVMALMGAGLT